MKSEQPHVNVEESIRQVGVQITDDGTEIQHFEQVSAAGGPTDAEPAVTLTPDQEATLHLAAHMVSEGHATARNTAVSLAETLQFTFTTAAELLAEAVAALEEH